MLVRLLQGLVLEDLAARVTALWAVFAVGVALTGALRGWRGRPWDWLAGMTAGLALLAAVAGASVVGTLIQPADLAEEVVYHSWWYEALLLLLGASVGCCTWRTLSARWRGRRRPVVAREPGFFESAPARASLLGFRGTAEDVARAFRRRGFRVTVVSSRAAGSGSPLGQPAEEKYVVPALAGHHEPTALQLRAVRGALGRWGAPVAHLGVVLVLAGGFASGWLAQRAYIGDLLAEDSEGWLREGDEVGEIVLSRTGDNYVAPGTDPATLGQAFAREGLGGLRVRCDEFETGFFPKSKIPSHYTTTLTLLAPGRAPEVERVEVNRSGHLGPWTVHQSSWIDDAGGTRFRLAVAPSAGKAATAEAASLAGVAPLPGAAASATTVTVALSAGQTRLVPALGDGVEMSLSASAPYRWTVRAGATASEASGAVIAQGILRVDQPSLTLRVARFEPDLVVNSGPGGGGVTSRSDELRNPAAEVEIREGDRPLAHRWIFQREEMRRMFHGAEQDAAAPSAELESAEGDAAHRRLTIRVGWIDDAGRPQSRVVDVAPGETVTAREAVLAADATASSATATGRQSSEAAASAGWRVRVVERVPVHATQLTLTRNPAMAWVYAGCAILLAGLLLAFAFPRREVWLRIVEEGATLEPRDGGGAAEMAGGGAAEMASADRAAVGTALGTSAAPPTPVTQATVATKPCPAILEAAASYRPPRAALDGAARRALADLSR